MARMKRIDEVPMAASARDRALQAAARMKPLAGGTRAAAKRGVHSTRAWAAPQVERTGRVLQDSVAPKGSALLSSAAQRLEPAKPPRRRWRKLAGISMLAAAATVVAALARSRRKPDVTTSPAEADADEVTSAAQMGDRQVRTSTDAEVDVNGHVRAS